MVSTDTQRVAVLRAAALTSAGGLSGSRRRRAARGLARLRTPEAARALAEVFVADPDGPVGGIVADALRSLSDPACLDAVSEAAIRSGDRRLRALIEATGHLPTRPQRRALWLFLDGRFDDAAELDFDGGLLRAAFQEADSELRRRMAARARESGRADWFGALAAVKERGRHGRVSEAEWEFTVDQLTGNRRWEELWRLAHQAPLPRAAMILQLLSAHDWLPEAETDRAGYARLVALAVQCRSPFPARFAKAKVLAEGYNYSEGFTLHGEAGLLATSLGPGHLGTSIGTGPSGFQAWRLPGGEELGVFRGPGSKGLPSAAAITPDGSTIAVGGWGEVSLRSVDTKREARRLRTGKLLGMICALAVTPDGELVIGADMKGNVWLWSRRTGTLRRRLRMSAGAPSMRVSSDGRLFAVGTRDAFIGPEPRGQHGSIRLWHMPSGEAAGTIEVGRSGVRFLHFILDSRYLVAAGLDGSTRIWNLPNPEPTASMEFDARRANVEISADGSLLVGRRVATSAIEVRHLPSGSIATVIDRTATDDPVRSRFAISADNRLLASAESPDGVNLWHLPSGAFAGRLTVRKTAFYPRYLAFTPHGALILRTFGDPGRVLMWRPENSPLESEPVSEITPAEVERLRISTNAVEDRPWLELLGALVEWRHRNDIELAEDEIRPPGATDIEATG